MFTSRILRTLATIAAGLVVFMLLSLVASVAWAAEGDESPTALAQFTEMAFQVLTPVVVIFATWGAHRLIRVFEKRTGIDVDAAREEQIDFWLEKGIYLAEEKSRKLAIEKAQKLKGPEKLEEAVTFAIEEVRKRNWDDWTRKQLENRAEALLGEKRAHGGKPSLDKGEGSK